MQFLKDISLLYYEYELADQKNLSLHELSFSSNQFFIQKNFKFKQSLHNTYKEFRSLISISLSMENMLALVSRVFARKTF